MLEITHAASSLNSPLDLSTPRTVHQSAYPLHPAILAHLPFSCPFPRSANQPTKGELRRRREKNTRVLWVRTICDLYADCGDLVVLPLLHVAPSRPEPFLVTTASSKSSPAVQTSRPSPSFRDGRSLYSRLLHRTWAPVFRLLGSDATFRQSRISALIGRSIRR